MNKISIIVPIYNTEKYLVECIESIIHQTYTNLQIILVDDGSTDHSLEICQEYAKKDDRIEIIHKENGGLSSARNAGLEASRGDYVMFCDADDFYNPNSCEILEKVITSNKADYAIGNYINCNEDSTLWEKPVFDVEKYPDFRLSIHDYEKSFFIMSSSVCNKIFRLSFVRGLQLKFRPKVPAEDAIFTTYCFMKAKSVYYVSDIIYNYRQRNGTSISTNNTLSYFEGISKAYYVIYRNFKINRELGFYRFFYLKSLFYTAYKFIDSTVMSYEERIKALELLNWFFALSNHLKIGFGHNDFSQFIEYTIQEEYDKAIKIAKKIADIRKDMSEEDKLKMSKIPPEKYSDYLLEKKIVEYPNIAFVVDVANWAFDIEAQLLKKKFKGVFGIDIFVSSEYDDNLYYILKDVKDYDRIHFFWRKLLLQINTDDFKRHFITEDAYLYFIDSVKDKISTGIYDHLFLDDDSIKQYSEILNHYCDRYYTCSKKLEDIYQSILSYPKPFGTIHDTYDNTLYDGGDKNRFHTRHRDALVIGWVGNSNWNIQYKDFKGFHSILKPAIEELREEGLNIEEFYADKNIRFRTNEEMPEYYQNIDVCVIVSTEEGTPRPILEGMASGVPIISTDVGIAREAFGPKQQGYILGNRNGENDLEIKEALKDKIRTLYQHRELLEELSEENYQYGIQNDIDHLLPLYMDFFRQE